MEREVKIILCVLHYKGIEYTEGLVDALSDYNDIIVIDAFGDFDSQKAEVIKIENMGFGRNWSHVVSALFERDWNFIWLSNNDVVVRSEPEDFFQNIQTSLESNPNIHLITPAVNAHHDYFECDHIDGGVPLRLVQSKIEFISPIMSREMFIRAGNFPLGTKYGFGYDNYYVDRCRRYGYDIAVQNNSVLHHVGSASAREVYGNTYFADGVNEYFAKLLPLIKRK